MRIHSIILLLCVLCFLGNESFAQRGKGSIVPPVALSDVSLDSLSRTDAYVSWKTPKPVKSYEIGYQSDSRLVSIPSSNAVGTSIIIPRTAGASVEAWTIRALFQDGTKSLQALVLEKGVTITAEDIFSVVEDNCAGDKAHDPELTVAFTDVCVLADMDALCQINFNNPQGLTLEDWTDTLTLYATLPNTGIIPLEDCDGAAVRTGTAQMITQMHAYPNPVQHVLHIETPASTWNTTATIQLMDMAGRTMVKSQVTLSNQTTIPMQNLIPGIYEVRVVAGDQIFRSRVIKQ